MTRKKVICTNCGKGFLIEINHYNYKVKHGKRRFFCSKKCADKGHSKLMSENNISKRPDVAGKISESMKEWHRSGKSRDAQKKSAATIKKKAEKAYVKKVCPICKKTFKSLKRWKKQTCSHRCSNIMGWKNGRWKNNPKKLSKSIRELYKKHPEKHPNYILANRKNSMKKSTEIPIFRILQKLGLKMNQDFFFNHYIRTKRHSRWADFAIPSIKLDIECDGIRFHNPLKDTIRNAESKEAGWKTLRLKEKEIERNPEFCKSKILSTLKELEFKTHTT